MSLASCLSLRDDGDVTAPEADSGLAVAAQTSTPEIFEGNAATVSAEASGGTPPYLYRWDQNAGPEQLDLSEITSATLNLGTLTKPGRYNFRVTVTDGAGNHGVDYVAVEVLATVEASAPTLAIVGEPAELSAELVSQSATAEFLWEVTKGAATLDDPAAAKTMLTTEAGETVGVRLTVTLPSSAEASMTATREFEIVSVHDLRPQVVVETNFGDFTIELDGENTPLHMVNFLLYVDDSFYDGLLFHRSVCTDGATVDTCRPFVLQGGGYRRVDGELVLVDPTRPPVVKETENSASNGVLYSVALALSGNDTDSGTTQFFINLDEDNEFLDDRGFTVFGEVVEGRDTVDAIVAIERTENPVASNEVSLPVEDVIMEEVRRVRP